MEPFAPRATSARRSPHRPTVAAREAQASASGRGHRDASFLKDYADFPGKTSGARLVAVQAERVGGDRHPLAREAGDIALLDHRQRLLHRFGRVLDHSAWTLARGERAVVRIAAVGKHFAADRDTGAF